MILKSLEIVKGVTAPAGFEKLAFRFVVNALTVFAKKKKLKLHLILSFIIR